MRQSGKYIVLALLISVFSVFFSTKIFAVTNNSSTTTPIIYTSDDCKYCKELETELKAKYPTGTYTIKNIDSTDTNKVAYQMALVACSMQTGAVPLYSLGANCRSGKENILEIMSSYALTNNIKELQTTEQAKVTLVADAVSLAKEETIFNSLSWIDYGLVGLVLAVIIAGIVILINTHGRLTQKAKVLFAGLGILVLAGFTVFLFVRVNGISSLSLNSAEAGKKSKTCIEDGDCKNFKDFIKAKQEQAEDRGDPAMRKKWKDISDKYEAQGGQAANDAAAAATQAAFKKALEEHPELCGAGATSCTFSDYTKIVKNRTDAATKCGTSMSASECAVAKANAYMREMYVGTKVIDASGNVTQVKGGVADAVQKYMEDQRAKVNSQVMGIARDLIKGACQTGDSADCAQAKKDICAKFSSSTADQNSCVSYLNGTTTTINFNLDKAIKTVTADVNSGLNVYIPDEGILGRKLVSTDECTQPTAGGSCPKGTSLCLCQKTPTVRGVCGFPGSDCETLCMATHNVCNNCKRIITKTETSSCQESCSADSPCTDGTSCVNGKCINPTCPNESDCLCNFSEKSCGDGLINDSPQAPEQCELGNPAGTSCDWNSCDHTTCKCPNNPNWTIRKDAKVTCVNPNTSNVYAKVDFDISATYTNASSPTTVGTLERVTDDPVGYRADWLVASSITNGGTYTTTGNNVQRISWDLTAPLSTFTIPSGQTSITKTNMLSYTYNVPKEYFGTYINLVTGYPNQTDDSNTFKYTQTVFISCEVPGTGLFDSTLTKVILGMFLIASGFVFAYSQKMNGLAHFISQSPIFYFFAPKQEQLNMKKEKFEKKILKKLNNK